MVDCLPPLNGSQDDVKKYLEELRRDLKQAKKSGALFYTLSPIKVTPEAQEAHGSEKLEQRMPFYQVAYQKMFMLSSEKKFEGEKEYAALYLDMRENEGEVETFLLTSTILQASATVRDS